MPGSEPSVAPPALVRASALRVLAQYGDDALLFAEERAQAAAAARDLGEENIWQAIVEQLKQQLPEAGPRVTFIDSD
jgi:hypothetical protein